MLSLLETPLLSSKILQSSRFCEAETRARRLPIPHAGRLGVKGDDEGNVAAHFAQHVFNSHGANHEHDCTETCIKYVKKKFEAEQSLRSNKVPSCRFWFFHVVTIKGKRRRRRGKPLVPEPYIADTDDRTQEFRCQVHREQPFRSTTNDATQATDTCNVDFQFLACAPPPSARSRLHAPRRPPAESARACARTPSP